MIYIILNLTLNLILTLNHTKPNRKVMMGDKEFIKRLKTYDKDNMETSIIEKIRKSYMTNEKFTPEAAAKVTCDVMRTRQLKFYSLS